MVDWVTADKESGSGSHDIELSIKENSGDTPREALVTVRSTDGTNIVKTVNLTQLQARIANVVQVTVTHYEMGSPSEGWYEAEYTINAEAQHPVETDLEIGVKLASDSHDTIRTLTIEKGNTAVFNQDIILGNSTGSWSDNYSILSISTYQDDYYNYEVY